VKSTDMSVLSKPFAASLDIQSLVCSETWSRISRGSGDAEIMKRSVVWQTPGVQTRVLFPMVHRDEEESSGLFSGVFNYVTKEVGSFVTNATGGVITVVCPFPPVPATKSDVYV